MSSTPAPRPRSRGVRAVLLVLGTAVVVGLGGWLIAQRYKPQWFDVETVNQGELDALQTANLAPAPKAGPFAEFGWGQWFGQRRDGRAAPGPLRTDWDKNPPKVLWTAPCGGGYAQPIVNRWGEVCVFERVGGQERVRWLDAETGKERRTASAWDADYAGIGYAAGPRATPSEFDGQVFALGATGRLVCLGSRNSVAIGGVITADPVPPAPPPPPEPQQPWPPLPVTWEHDLRAEFDARTPTWGFASSPLVWSGMVVAQAGGKKGSVVAFDYASGKLLWAAGTDPNGYSSPVSAVCAGVAQVIAVTGQSILGIRGSDGQVLWRHEWRTEFNGNIATPLVIGDYVFVSSGYGKGCVLLHLVRDGDGVREEVVYFRKARVMRNHHSTCVHKDGFLYGYDDDTLRCVDLRKGEVVEDWVAKDAVGSRLQKGGVILAGDHLIGLTQTGTLFLADADPTEFRFRGKVDGVLSGSDCWALPVLVDGRIYLRDNEKVVCLDARPAAK